MTAKGKTILLLVAVILLALVAYWQILPKYKEEINQIIGKGTEQQGKEGNNLVQPEIRPATGNIDDIVSALLSESSSDLTDFSGEAADSALMSSDNQEISDFAQIYDENEF